MSYPQPPGGGGGYPYPPNPQYPGVQSNLGFSQSSQGQGSSYLPYPQGGGGFPCPPNIPVPNSYPSLNSAPSSSPYPPQSNSSLPYELLSAPNPSPFSSQPTQGSFPYPSQSVPNSSPFAPTSAPYSVPYPPQNNPDLYSTQFSSSSAPYPPNMNPYSQSSAAPYPPSNTYSQMPAQSSPYAPSNPYPQTPTQSSPYPPGNSSYSGLSATSAGSLGAPPTFQGQSSSPYHASSQSSHPTSYAGCMFPYQDRPTLRPVMPFDPSTDAATLRKAMKGFGTDEASITRILGRRTSNQRQDIKLRYQQSFGKDLVKDLKSELSGDFGLVVESLMIPLPMYLAQQLNKAVMGLGTNERTLIEILCTNDNNTLRNVKMTYQNTYRKPLEADLRGDTSGYFGRLMVAMATAFRDETSNDTSLAPGLAQSLYSAGVKKLGTDEAEFIRILSSYSYPLLRCVFEEYRKISGGKTFESAIRSELSGDFRDGMLSIYWCINNRAALFARYLHEAMRGLGTRDEALIRIVISRSEIDMGNIKDEFRKAYGKRLEDVIAGDTSGDYKKILLALIQG